MADAAEVARFGLEPVAVPGPGSPPELPDAEEEALHASFADVALVLGERRDQGAGSVHVTTRRIIWASAASPARGLAAPFSGVTLHAVSQASESQPKACIYIQMATELEAAEEAGSDASGEADAVAGADAGGCAELRLVPADASVLPAIFDALCTCAALNPEDGEDGDDEEEEGSGGFFYDSEAALAGAGGGERGAMLAHLDSLLTLPRADQLDELLAEDPQRFDDAEEAANGHSDPRAADR